MVAGYTEILLVEFIAIQESRIKKIDIILESVETSDELMPTHLLLELKGEISENLEKNKECLKNLREKFADFMRDTFSPESETS